MSKDLVQKENKFLSISKVIDSEISTVLASNANGFQKAYVTSSAISIIKEQLTDEYMIPIMSLQGSSLGFKTDQDTIKVKEGNNWTTKKGPGYPMEILKECLIEATFLGLEVTGNQFNIIGGNMYPTREGFGALLDKIEGLKKNFTYTSISQPAGQKVANVKVRIDWQFEGKDAKKQEIDFPIKSNEYTSYDALIGKAERKAKRWLYNTIKGTDISDGDANENPIVEAEIVKDELLIELNRLFELVKSNLNEKEIERCVEVIDNEEVNSYDKTIKFLKSKIISNG